MLLSAFFHLWNVWGTCFWTESPLRYHGQGSWISICLPPPVAFCASVATCTGWHSLWASDSTSFLLTSWQALFHKLSLSGYHITYIVEHSISFSFLSFIFFECRNLFDWMWWHQRQKCGKILNGEKSISANLDFEKQVVIPELTLYWTGQVRWTKKAVLTCLLVSESIQCLQMLPIFCSIWLFRLLTWMCA